VSRAKQTTNMLTSEGGMPRQNASPVTAVITLLRFANSVHCQFVNNPQLSLLRSSITSSSSSSDTHLLHPPRCRWKLP
jgi:hypothetical protein